MAAIGPDFKSGYVDPLPVSNADVGTTAAQFLGLRTRQRRSGGPGDVRGPAQRHVPKMADGILKSQPSANGLHTVLKFQRVRSTRYFDVAGFCGRTLGLDAEGGKQKTAGK